MPTFIPDRLKTPGNFPSIDANDNQIRGFGFFANATARTALDENFRCEGYLAFMKDTDQFKQYNNTVVDDSTWGNDSNWVLLEGTSTDTYWAADGDGTGIYYSNQVIVGATTYSGTDKFYVSGGATVTGSLKADIKLETPLIHSSSGLDVVLNTDESDTAGDDFRVRYRVLESGGTERTAFDISPYRSTATIEFGNTADDFKIDTYSSSFSEFRTISSNADETGFKFSDIASDTKSMLFRMKDDDSYLELKDGGRKITIAPHTYKISSSVEANANVLSGVEMLMPDSATGDWTFNHLSNKDYVFNTNTSSSTKLITKFHAFGSGVVSIGTANHYNEYSGIQYTTVVNSLQPRLFIVNDGTSNVGVRVQSGNTSLGQEGARTQGRYFTDIRDDGFYISRVSVGPLYDAEAEVGEEWDNSVGNPEAATGIKRGDLNGNSMTVFARNDVEFSSNGNTVFSVVGGGDAGVGDNHKIVLQNHSGSTHTESISILARPTGNFTFEHSNIGTFLTVYRGQNKVDSGSQILASSIRGAQFNVKSLGDPSLNDTQALSVYALPGNTDNTGYWWGVDGESYDTEAELIEAGTTVDTEKQGDQVAIYVPKHGSGKVGIGTDDPTSKLHVVGNAYVSQLVTLGNNLKFAQGSSGNNFISVSRGIFDIRPDASAGIKIPRLYLGNGTSDTAQFAISGFGSHFESNFTIGFNKYFGFKEPRGSGWIQTNPAKVLSVDVTDNVDGDVDTQFWSTLQGVTNNNMTLLSSGRLKLGSGGTSFNMPSSDGSPGYVLKTNGSGDVSWDANSGFDTVAEMKAASLSPGDLVATQGYLSYGDGGGMFYEIKPSSDDLTDDGGSVITLDNGNFAKAIISGPVTPLAWGLKINDSDSSVATANTTALNNMFSYVGNSIYSSNDATVSVLFPGELIYINGEVKLPIGAAPSGVLRKALYVIDFNGSKVVGLDTGSPYTMFARRKTDLDQKRFGSVQSSSGVDYMSQRVNIVNGNIEGPNRTPGMTLLRIDCTYNSLVEQMDFSNAEYGLRMHFCLNARVQNNRYNSLNYGLYLSHGDWSGASTANSACNVSQVFQDRHYCTYPSKAAITVRGSSGVKLTDCIVEGSETEVGIHFNALGGTTVKDFTIDGLHLEVADSGSNEGVTRAAIRIEAKTGGETTIQRIFAQYDYKKFEWANRLTKSNTSSATEGTYTLSQDDGDLTTDGDGTGLVMKVVVSSSGNISSIDLAGDPDRSWGFAAGDTVTIPPGKLGASSTEASFEIRRGDVKEHGVLQNKVPMYDAPRSGGYGRIHIGEVYNVGSFISTQELWLNVGGGTHFASGANFGNRNTTLYDAITKYGRHAIAYDNAHWVALNVKGVGFDFKNQDTSTTSGLVDGYYILKQSDGDFTTDGSGQGLILRFHVEDGAISYWDVGGQGASGGNAGLSNTSNQGLSQATDYAGGDVITIPANSLGTGSSQFTITITNDSKLSNGVPEFGFSRTPYYAYFNNVHSRGSSRNTSVSMSGGTTLVQHTDGNAGIQVGSNFVKNYFTNSWSVRRRTGYSNGSAGDSGTETDYLSLSSGGVLSLNQQDYRNMAAGKGLIVTTPDNTKRYRIAVDNDGNLTTTFVSNV